MTRRPAPTPDTGDGPNTAAQSADLILSTELAENPPPVLLSSLIYAIVLVFGAAVVWAGLTRIDEVVRAPGEALPEGDVVTVRHIEGGVVDQVAVRNAQRVAAGDTLLRLSTTAVDAELSQLRARRDQLHLSLLREQAVVDGGVLDGTTALDQAQAREQARLMRAQQELQGAELETQRALIAEVDARMAAVRVQIPNAQDAAADLAEDAAAIAELFARGAAARERMSRARREARNAAARVLSLEADLALEAQVKRSAEAKLAEMVASQHAGALSRTAPLIAELAELTALIADAESRLERLTVRAPVDGVITELAVHGASDVVAPAQELLRIVPANRALLIEARVSPGDIGKVGVGQPAALRVDAYDSAHYGVIAGAISEISATTQLDDDAKPFYRVIVTPERDYFGDRAFGAQLLPGMTVEAEIKNRDRSLLSYLLKPISRGWSRAFHEE